MTPYAMTLPISKTHWMMHWFHWLHMAEAAPHLTTTDTLPLQAGNVPILGSLKKYIQGKTKSPRAPTLCSSIPCVQVKKTAAEVRG